MPDAIDELVARSIDDKELRAFHEFHRSHPEVLDFLVREIQLRIEHGFPAFAYRSLWEYCRWKLQMDKGPGETFLMNDHAAPIYARAIAILHPEFNGLAELRHSKADSIFGVQLEAVPDKRPKHYARRLEWADGTPLERGWRPTNPHVPSRAATTKPHIHTRRAERPEPRLHGAARLILTERDSLAHSAPRGTLRRLEALASELREIEARL